MAKIYTKLAGGWVDEVLADVEKYQLKDDVGTVIYDEAQLALATAVVTPGTPIDAVTMQNIEDGIDAIDTLVDSHSISIAAHATSLNTGWMPVTDSWTYASASTITVPAGATATYSAYSKAKFTQHGVVKQGYIYPTSDTLLTFYAGSNFAVEDTATYPITSIYYSNSANPIGFPHWFNYAATVSGSGGSIGTYAETSYVSKFEIIGRTAHVKVMKYINNVGSWSGTFQVLRPISSVGWTPLNTGGVYTYNTLTNKGIPYSSAASAYFIFMSNAGAANLAWGGAGVVVNDSLSIDGFYEV
jgi:hypothetical protein